MDIFYKIRKPKKYCPYFPGSRMRHVHEGSVVVKLTNVGFDISPYSYERSKFFHDMLEICFCRKRDKEHKRPFLDYLAGECDNV